MSFKQSFILAIKSLSSSKMRAFLTMLGIIIGVAAVIILVSLVDGFKNNMLDQFNSLGANTIAVSIQSRGGTRTVSVEDMLALCDEYPDVLLAASPNVTAGGKAKIGTEELSSSITGVSENYLDVTTTTVEQGRFLTFNDVNTRQKVCVVGSYISKEFFGGNAVGESLKINGNTFKIVGVFEEAADSTEGSSDDKIIIPYTTVRSITRISFVSSYTFAAVDENKSEQAKSVIETYLLSIFNSDDYYTVISMAEMLDMVDELTGQITLILVGIAGISLLVGGIGIMNIMLVSVTERTREIGIRKSLGARRFDIMSQFVVEAATTSAVGGVVGILLGIAVSYAAGALMSLKVTPSPAAILIAFSFSAAIGIMFGYFPANKAAKLNPIDALRHD
mgnify:CR=1 FL=1